MKKIKIFINKILLVLKVFLFFIIDSLAKILTNSHYNKSILILNLSGLGDFLIHLKTYEEIRKYFPKHKIYYLCPAEFIDFAKKINCFDEIISINMSKFFLGLDFFRIDFRYIFYRFFKFIEIEKKYEFIFNIDRRELFFNILSNHLSAKNKFGFKQISFNNKFFNSFFDNGYTKIVQTDNRHFLWSMKDFFKETINNYELKDDLYYLPKINFYVEEFQELKEKKYIIFSLGAFDGKRRWSIENFLELEKKIDIEADFIVLIGNKKEVDLGIFFEKRYYSDKSRNRKILNLIGKTDILELNSIIRYAKLFIGNDSGSTHLAVVNKTPSICILAGGSFNEFFPYFLNDIESIEKCNNICVYNYMKCFECNHNCKFEIKNIEKFPCINNISVEHVFEKYLKLRDFQF